MLAVLNGVAPDYRNTKIESWLYRLSEFCDDLPESQLLHRGRNEIFRAEQAGISLVIKRFTNHGCWKRVAYRYFASSKARRSFEHSGRLLAAGLQSPAPVAWVEFRKGGWLIESFYVSLFQSCEHDGHALLESDWPERKNKARLAGAAVGRMHEAGIAHLDLNGGNLLFYRDPGGGWNVSFIDNNRMAFGRLSPRRGIRLLLTAGQEGEALDAFLDGYSQYRNLSFEFCRKTYAHFLKLYKLKWNFKNATRPWRRRLGL